MKSSTETIIGALRILVDDIQSADGVANAVVGEAADRMEELAANAVFPKALMDALHHYADIEESDGFFSSVAHKAIAAAPAVAQPATPQGYKLVPIEPTTAMIVAIEDKVDSQLAASGIHPTAMQRQDGEHIYSAMIATAPVAAQPAAPQGWNIVPAKITEDMTVAFSEAWFIKRRCFDDPEMQDCYAAMLAAAPNMSISAPKIDTSAGCVDSVKVSIGGDAEFKWLVEFWAGKHHSSLAPIRAGNQQAWDALVAYIDSRAAPIAPTAAPIDRDAVLEEAAAAMNQVPMWTNCGILPCEAQRVLREMKSAAPVAPPAAAEQWIPTAKNINELPQGIRRFVHDLVARCDPAGDVAQNIFMRDQCDGLQIMYRKAADALEEVIGCFNAAEIEGLSIALAETQDEHLKDLVERRLMYALYAAQTPELAEQWISVDDRLPAKGQHVLAYRPTAHITQDTPICITFYSGVEKEDWQDVKHKFNCLCHPTHWMLIPDAPAAPADKQGGA